MPGPFSSLIRRSTLTALALFAFPALAHAGVTCAPGLIDNGLPGPTSGTNGLVVAQYNNDLYLGQTSSVGADGLALMRRVDNQWVPVGGGLQSSVGEAFVSSMVVFDPDGDKGITPELLIVSGVFDVEGVRANIVAWNGLNFVDIYDPLNTAPPIGVIAHDGWIRSLAVFDPDGNGPLPESLVAVGEFNTFQGNPALNQMIRWDGTNWHPMYSGEGPGGPFSSTYFPHRLVVTDPDGSGPQPESLYMLLSDNSAMPRCLSKWDVPSQGWIPFGGFFVNNEGGSEIVFDLTSYDPDGAGPEPVSLVAAGTVFGANRVAYFNAPMATWQPLPGAPAGIFANANTYWVTLAKWDPPGPTPNTLFMGRGFELAGAPISQPAYAFDGQSYSAIPIPAVAAVRSLDVLDDLLVEPGLHFAGQSPGPGFVSKVARYSGGSFVPAVSAASEVFALTSPEDVEVTATTVINSANLQAFAPTLIVATRNDHSDLLRGSAEHHPLYSWNGSQFVRYADCTISRETCCTPAIVNAMSPVDPDGLGPLTEADGLAIVGDFDLIDRLDFAGPVDARGIAVWNGSTWLRPSIDSIVPTIKCVAAVPSSIAAGQPAVFVGGQFNAIGGVGASNAAIWIAGTTLWNGLGLGTSGTVRDAVVFDPDGAGVDFDPKLYVVGDFSMAGGLDSRGIATWDFINGWQPVFAGDLDSPAYDLQLWDSDGPIGNPPRLAAAGLFNLAGGLNAPGFAVLDDSTWRGLGDASIEWGTRLGVLDPDGDGSAGEKLYGVLSNLGGIRRLAGLRSTGASTTVWDTVAGFGPSQFNGGISLSTFDEDGAGVRPETLVAAGDMLSPVGGVPTDGLIRVAAPQRFLVENIFATLNGAGAYLCGMIPGVNDHVVFDYTLVTNNPDTQGFADLIAPLSFGSMSVLGGEVHLNLFGNTLTLANPDNTPALVLGDGRLDEVDLYVHSSMGSSVLNSSGLLIGGVPSGQFISQNLIFDNITANITGDVQISPFNAGGVLWVFGDDSILNTNGNVRLGEGPIASGELFVLGGEWNHTGGGTLEVAGAGIGNIDIDGGTAVTTDFTTITIGAQPDSGGTIDVGASAASTWSTSDVTVFVGGQGNGLLKVQNGSTVGFGLGSHLVIGHVAGSSGVLRVEDASPLISEVLVEEISIGLFGGSGEVLLDSAGGMTALEITVGPNGVIKGQGGISTKGALSNRGLISPGFMPGDAIAGSVIGTFELSGFYDQLSAPENDGIPGRLAIDIDATGPGVSSDQINVELTAFLGGQLDVRFVDGVAPPAGALSSGLGFMTVALGISDQFDVANFPGLSPGVTGAPRFLRFEVRPVPAARGGSAMEVAIIEDTLASPPPQTVDESQDYDVGGAGNDAALGDLNGDGTLDIAITVPNPTDPVNTPGSVVLLFNAGSVDGFWQGFTMTSQITVPANPSAISVADFDGENGLDVCFTALSTQQVYVMLNDGAGNFSFLRGTVPPTGVAGLPRNTVPGDFNRDGVPDVAVITDIEPSLTLLLGDRPVGGTFTGFIIEQVIPIPTTAADGVSVDIDNDKWDEIVIPDEDDESITVQNNGPLLRGAPVFNPVPVLVPVPGTPVDVDASDLNLDGFKDVAFASRDGGTVTILLGNGSPTFLPPITVPAGTGPTDLALVDLDEDDDADVAVVTGNDMGQRIIRIIRNDLFGGLLNFAPQTDLVPGAEPQLVLGGDVTGDGNPDLITVNNDGGVLRGGTQNEDVSVFTFAACRGDANNDRVVDMKDISATLTNWQFDYSPGTGPGDANGDGVVNFEDITSSLRSWGRDCR